MNRYIPMIAVFFSAASLANVDSIWNLSPSANDTLWAQQWLGPVNPGNSGSQSFFTTTDTSTLGNGVTYTNTTGKPMLMTVRGSIQRDVFWRINIYVNGNLGSSFGRGDGAGGNWTANGTVMIPAGATYMLNKSPGDVAHSNIRWW